MPLGFANNIFTSSGVSVGNTQSAVWDDSVYNGDFTGTTSLKKFGSYAIQSNRSTADYDDTDSTLTIYPTDTNFRFNSNFAWTIEFWLGLTNTNSQSQSHAIFETTLIGENLDDTTTTEHITANGDYVYLYAGGGDQTENNDSFAEQMVHVALVSDGSGGINWWMAGSRKISPEPTFSYTGDRKACAFGFRGTRNSDGPAVVFDEIRISNIARYSGASITQPTSAFTPDENTIALFHCENNLTDSSRG
jgi:hypothetical protein